MRGFDYASILFHGGCNLNCIECVGQRDRFRGMDGNLGVYPLKGLDGLLRRVNQLGITYLSLSGIYADPQMYPHEQDLLEYIRDKCDHRTDLVLHTNGLLALKKLHEFNMYDRVTLSFPSYMQATYQGITRSTEVLHIEDIIRASKVPIKLSLLLTEYNQAELDDYLRRSWNLGIRRVVVRELFGKEGVIRLLENMAPSCWVHGNPVYDVGGMEVTLWSYSRSTARALYLFPNGVIHQEFI